LWIPSKGSEGRKQVSTCYICIDTRLDDMHKNTSCGSDKPMLKFEEKSLHFRKKVV